MPFTTLDPKVDETALPNETPKALALRLAIAKAQTPLAPGSAWILGSDQVLTCKSNILGKPGSRDNAIRQLEMCSGSKVTFYTAVCLANGTLKYCDTRIVQTDVSFRSLSRNDIEAYVEQEPAFDCAGSFKVEGLGISLFTEVRSSDPTALEGLPLISVYDLLLNAGVRPVAD